MPLNIHNKLKERLADILTEHLPQILTNKQKFIDRRSMLTLFKAEKAIPASGEIKEKLDQFIGETPVIDFIYENLSQNLYEHQEYEHFSQGIPLSDLDGYQEIDKVANKLVEDLDSLPWSYTFTVKLHKEIAEPLLPIITNRTLGDSITIVQTDEVFEGKYPLESGIELRDKRINGSNSLLIPTPAKTEWGKSNLCIQFKQDGFVGLYGDTETSENVRDDFKSFCGLGIALRLFKVETKFRATPQKAKFYIHRKLDEGWVIQNTQEMDTAISETFHDLILHDLNGVFEDENDLKHWVHKTLLDIDAVYKHREQNQKLLNASRWLFESYTGKNELLSFVQTTVVIEILLGDKDTSDQMGLGALLRNRCAYLIGDSQSQRDELLEDFKKIYDVRSKIVHGGKNRLNYIEKSLFRRLQWMCRRVIAKEVELLKKDITN
ncbi:hypothetical protein [Neptuniibacter sp. QD48_11]|uniref:hypothetical protein n=1 Tax=Neptuniibacter sp. QD48_11 TaxID=3398211 RepID=UPI0039F5408A